MIERVGAELLVHEGARDFALALHSRGDEDLQRELVDVPRAALGGMEQAAHRSVGEQLLAVLGVLELKLDVVARVLEGEGPQGLDVADARAQRLQPGVAESVEERLSASEQEAEAVLGVELVGGEAPQEVHGLQPQAFGVVEDEDGMPPVLVAVAVQVEPGGVKHVCGVQAHGQREDPRQGAQEADGRGWRRGRA